MPYKDPVKQKAYTKRDYENNKEKYQKSSKECNNQRVIWFNELKSQMVCKECGENRPQCLDFHHRDPKVKEFNLASKLKHLGKKRILAEIAKCDVLCKNCHADFHYQERQNGGSVCQDLL
jgi:hypothetical protein